eukprot:CAMPEP_0184188240 /NCGR_PEP_ID=MMETSP0976-20121227/1342_1 /TAXON_ID=483370 /ORGANISM="non described non described, Strain CCMP2097" /LENGTH=99 /DNA_ID=CAMNT_0026492567 /DNA_START=143 /DNA_END=442 /DNA_ORIENTATION=+
MYVASVARRESSRKAIFERTLSSSRPWRGESVSIVWLKTQCPGKTATRDASSTSGTTAAPAAVRQRRLDVEEHGLRLSRSDAQRQHAVASVVCGDGDDA